MIVLTDILWVDDTFASEYEQGREFFFSFLVELNVNVYIIELILQFPIMLFSDGEVEKSIFLAQVVDNFLQQSILIITKLVGDQGRGEKKQVYTLRQFRNKVVKHAKAEYKEHLLQQLANSDFETKTSALVEKAARLRDWYIAHFTPGFFQESFAKTIQVDRLRFSEIKVLCDELNKLFEALTFGAGCDTLPRSYKNDTSDIQRVLDSIARNSDILNMPEDRPSMWLYKHQMLTEDEISQLNHYRKKFDLPEI